MDVSLILQSLHPVDQKRLQVLFNDYAKSPGQVPSHLFHRGPFVTGAERRVVVRGGKMVVYLHYVDARYLVKRSRDAVRTVRSAMESHTGSAQRVARALTEGIKQRSDVDLRCVLSRGSLLTDTDLTTLSLCLRRFHDDLIRGDHAGYDGDYWVDLTVDTLLPG